MAMPGVVSNASALPFITFFLRAFNTLWRPIAEANPLGKDFSHEHARSRAFRWGEDGIAGVSDTHGLQNIAFAFWNEEE
jgi:hypothetical protein